MRRPDIKERVIKVVCRVPLPLLSGPPLVGDLGVVLQIPAGPGPGAIRYCAEFGETVKKNDGTLYKAKDAPAPASCTATPF